MARNILNKGWRIHTHGGAFQNILRLEEFLTKKNPGDAVLRMQCSPITAADLDQVRGLFGKVQLPATAGLSGVGIVAEGAGALKEGDYAVLAGVNGAWGQYAVSSSAIRVPSTIPLEYAAILATGPMVAYRILKASGLQAGDTMVLSGAHTPVGLAAMQLAKAWGIEAVGIANGAHALKLEKLKQMGLNVVSGSAIDASQLFGSSRPRFGLSLVGGSQSATLAQLLGDGGSLVVCPTASDESHIIPSAELANKSLLLQTFSAWKSIQAANAAESEEMVAELCDLITGHKLKANAIVRHELANLLDAIPDAEQGLHNVVVMHEGTEKTWANKNHDVYMAIDEQLQANWDAGAAAQDPYLKIGRDQPWKLLAEADGDLDLPAELKAKFAAVTTEQELMAVLQTLSFKEKHLLGLPDTQAVTVSAEELKKLVADFAQ